MIIIGSRYGRLGNRLFLFSHFISNSIEYDYKLLNPAFQEYGHYFDLQSERTEFRNIVAFDNSCRSKTFLEVVRFIERITRRNLSLPNFEIIRHWKEDSFDLNNERFISMARKKIVLTYGWLFRDYPSLTKHQNSIRKIFTPQRETMENVHNLISTARENCDILIGVHLRKGDYRHFMDGTYYYTDENYLDIMKRMAAIFDSHRIGFLLCSDENVNVEFFEAHSLNFNVGTRHEVEDMYAFSQCDYLIGPPSTYTMWASFYGRIPLYQISNPDKTPQLNDFKICTS